MSYKKCAVLLMMTVLFTGCATMAPTAPTVSENEAFKYEKEYLAESETLKNNFLNSEVTKWVQPTNKKEPCKTYVGVDANHDYTLDKSFKVFWDGDCKDGYAYGLGREFERGSLLNIDAVAFYKEPSVKPQYYIQKSNLDNKVQEGDINKGYYVETTIIDENFKFDIVIQSGFMGSPNNPYRLVTFRSLFNDNIQLRKDYTNFTYVINDMSDNEFDPIKYQFEMRNFKGSQNFYGFYTPKNGQVHSVEVVGGKIKRAVKLPDSYIQKASKIYNEIAQATQNAKDAQKVSLKVKKQYINKICKDSVQVTFIDNSEYKAICNESENSNFKEKIKSKFAEINTHKQQKREQRNQQKIVDAQQRQADAAKQANNTESWGKIFNEIEDVTNQIRQQTNSYSNPTIVPSFGLDPLNNRKVQNCYTISDIEFCN